MYQTAARIGFFVSAMLFWGQTAIANEGSRHAAYALLIGSNRPGEGQSPLKYAWMDASRMEDVLSQLGGFSRGRIKMLQDPGRSQVVGAIEVISAKIAQHVRRGEKASFVFYYSGHARSYALNIGTDELSLETLRELVKQVPAHFKLIVLDACQTGAISNVKGVSPAASFSYNSVAGLNSEGMAVMASSAASELAQESEQLKGSFFTHHLVVGLRGAADRNGDGQVTLNEAYEYSYNRTLVDTAKTAVGKQHATLETELRGKGEMVLSRPNMAKTQLHLPADMSGEVLVYRSSDKQVMAELHKSSYTQMRIALPPNGYTVLVRQPRRGFECERRLSRDETWAVDLSTCDRISLRKLRQKGKGPRRRVEHLYFEVGLGFLVPQTDSYLSRLEDFGLLESEKRRLRFHFGIGAFYTVLRYLSIGVVYTLLDDNAFASETESISWRAQRFGFLVRGQLPLANDYLTIYIQAGGGAGTARSDYNRDTLAVPTEKSDKKEVSYRERFLGYQLFGGGGLQLTPWQHIGFFWHVERVYAPVLDNLLGDTHDCGGWTFLHGIKAGF